MRTLSFLFVLAVLLSACERPRVDAAQMRKSMGPSVFYFNKYMNTGEFDSARKFVVDSAVQDFESLVGSFREGRYNVGMSPDEPDIDYLKASARVKVQYFKGQYREHPTAAPAEEQTHVWKYEDGKWRWAGRS